MGKTVRHGRVRLPPCVTRPSPGASTNSVRRQTCIRQLSPESGKKSARASAEVRYRQFVEHVAAQFSGGRRFLDDLPHEAIGDEGELAAVAESSAMGHAKGESDRSRP